MRAVCRSRVVRRDKKAAGKRHTAHTLDTLETLDTLDTLDTATLVYCDTTHYNTTLIPGRAVTLNTFRINQLFSTALHAN